MALQVRISLPDFSSGVNFTDPIILENAADIDLKKTVSSDDEGISFTLPLTDPKLASIDYLRWWECWDTETNQRVNYGPITTMERASGDSKRIAGPGRSALLQDYYKSIQTFYMPIEVFLEELTLENLVSEPKTATIININTSSDYYGLSKRSKDYAIDEQTGYIPTGRDVPERGTIKAAEFWSGTGKADWLTIDLGEDYTISKINILFPWWGGVTVNNSRLYAWEVYYSSDNSSWTQVTAVTSPNLKHSEPAFDGISLYFGDPGNALQQLNPSATAITARYWKINITNTYAMYGNLYAGTLGDAWDWECNNSGVLLGNPTPSPTVSTGDLIPKVDLGPGSDCYASVVEVGIKKTILGKDTITNLSYHQIQDNNRQISYYHYVAPSEMISTETSTIKKFEPGTFFRNIVFTGTGVSVTDEYNTLIYQGGGDTIQCPAYCRMLKFSGDAAVAVTEVDAWKGQFDAYSFGGSYSYSTTVNDYAILDFRGVSLIWYATIPSTETAGTVKIELRSKTGTNVWSAWSTLENSYALTNDIAAKKVYEITYESGTLQVDTSYQLRITNLDGGYVSIDAFAGFWSGTMTTINEDDATTKINDQRFITQFFDSKFLNGSINQFHNATSGQIMEGITFVGDRFIVYSRKYPGSGLLKIGLYKWPEYEVVYIPGGLADGTINVDLNSNNDIPQAVIFDSKDYFPDGLEWRGYGVGIYTAAGVDALDTWTLIWRYSSVTNPAGTYFDPANPGYVYVISETTRRIYRVNQSTGAATAVSGALFAGYAGGLSGDPSDSTIVWVLEAPWLSGSGSNTRIHKVRKSDWTITATYDMGSAIHFTAIKVSANYVWCTRYDGSVSLYKISKSTGGVLQSYTVVYGGVTQTGASGVSVNGTKLLLWYDYNTRALEVDESDPTTVTRAVTTGEVVSLGGDWTTENGLDYLYMDNLYSDYIWKYQITGPSYLPIWLDGFDIHQTNGLSVKFINNSYLDIVKSTAEALQMEWEVTEAGLKVVPRIGTDTDVIMAEGRGTTIKIQDVEDVSKVATQLILTGSDIDGLPLTGIVEDRKTKRTIGRTIQRAYDLRNVSDQFTLIGAGRTELARRSEPEKRITITRAGTLEVSHGDSFIAKTPEIEVRVRANTITRHQSSSGGTEYVLECTRWPVIV